MVSLNCEEVRESMYWLLDGELDIEQTNAIKEHLRYCGACRSIYEKQRDFKATLRKAHQPVVAPNSLRLQVADTLKKENKVVPLVGRRRWEKRHPNRNGSHFLSRVSTVWNLIPYR